MEKILVIRNDRFGEFLLNIPAIRALRSRYPSAKIVAAVSGPVRELAGMLDCIDEALAWDKDFRKNLRGQGFGLCVIFNPTKEAHWAAFRAGIPLRVGYDRKWGFLLTHRKKDEKCLGARHEVEYNLELVSLLTGESTAEKWGQTPFLSVPEGSDKCGCGPFLAIHPFTSDPLKQWPLEWFMELARSLASKAGAKVVLVGRSESWPGLGEEEGLGVVDLVNKTSLVELAQVLKQARLLISCDSGPMHLGAAVGTPVVALFRNDLPGKTARRWGPWGPGHAVIEKSRLEDISVEEVLDKARNIGYS